MMLLWCGKKKSLDERLIESRKRNVTIEYVTQIGHCDNLGQKFIENLLCAPCGELKMSRKHSFSQKAFNLIMRA